MGYCPECGAGYEPAVAACPRCRVVLTAEPPGRREPVVVQRVPDVAAGALLCGMLQRHGIPAVFRSTSLPAYGTIPRDWSSTAWGEVMVPRNDFTEARAVIAEYLLALERGGPVRDDDVEGVDPG